jgi:uncharacterized membrane protein YgcG
MGGTRFLCTFFEFCGVDGENSKIGYKQKRSIAWDLEKAAQIEAGDPVYYGKWFNRCLLLLIACSFCYCYAHLIYPLIAVDGMLDSIDDHSAKLIVTDKLEYDGITGLFESLLCECGGCLTPHRCLQQVLIGGHLFDDDTRVCGAPVCDLCNQHYGTLADYHCSDHSGLEAHALAEARAVIRLCNERAKAKESGPKESGKANGGKVKARMTALDLFNIQLEEFERSAANQVDNLYDSPDDDRSDSSSSSSSGSSSSGSSGSNDISSSSSGSSSSGSSGSNDIAEDAARVADEENISRERAVAEMKRNFYATYAPIYEKTQVCSNLITQKKYDFFVRTLKHLPSKQKGTVTQEDRRISRKYTLGNNVAGNELYRDGLRVPTYEGIFDIIWEAHAHISHQRCIRRNKAQIKLQWYGVPESACRIFLSMCMECMTSRKPSAKAKMNPLNMILSESVGSRAQMDLIDMQSQPFNGYNWILRYGGKWPGLVFSSSYD